MENIVDEIKSRCNIVDVIGQAVSLKKTGGNYKGLCPFHNEKTPSFVVSETKQMFYCFGCNASGDVFEFVKRYYNLDFTSTLEKLAEQYGVSTDGAYYKSPNYSSSNKVELFETNRKAAKFFYKTFSDSENPGALYMRSRGIEEGILKKFGIGYAAYEWDSLSNHFAETESDIKPLIALGLAAESKGKIYDKFRNRVMFPIINPGGKVIGFGGRALDESVPKYLNSPESPVFLKKNNLFGLNLTRQDISKENRAILVEGYMDVISLYQHGVRNVCASLGTAFTENQARLLKRYTLNVIVSYDADQAGQAAAIRGAEILYKEGLNGKVLKIPSDKDPDDFIRKNGKQEFMNLVEKAVPYAAYRIETIKDRHDLAETEDKVAFVKEAVAFLKTLSPAHAEMYIKAISKDTKISESAIALEYSGNKTANTIGDVYHKSDSDKNRDWPDILEKNLIKLCILSRDYFERTKPYERAFGSRYGYEIFKSVESGYSVGDEIDLKKLADGLDEECEGVLNDTLESVFLAGKEEKVFADCVARIRLADLKNRENEIVLKISMADEVDNSEQIDSFTRELIEVQMEIQKIKI